MHPIYNKIEVTPPRASITPWEQKIEVNKSDLILPCKSLAPRCILALGKQHAVKAHDPEFSCKPCFIMSMALTPGQNPMGEEIGSAIACCTAAFVYTLYINFKQIMYTEHASGTCCSSFCTDLCFLTLKNVFVSPC